jgi:uncharacterized protein YukE
VIDQQSKGKMKGDAVRRREMMISALNRAVNRLEGEWRGESARRDVNNVDMVGYG